MTDNRQRPMGPPKTLRELRLWHWRKVVLHRERAIAAAEDTDRLEALHAPKKFSRVRENAQHGVANWHLAAVQVLNDHFPVGDTAERDNARAG